MAGSTRPYFQTSVSSRQWWEVVVCSVLLISISAAQNNINDVQSWSHFPPDMLHKTRLLASMSDVSDGRAPCSDGTHSEMFPVPIPEVVSSQPYVDLKRSAMLLGLIINNSTNPLAVSSVVQSVMDSQSLVQSVLQSQSLVQSWVVTGGSKRHVSTQPWYINTLPWPEDKFQPADLTDTGSSRQLSRQTNVYQGDNADPSAVRKPKLKKLQRSVRWSSNLSNDALTSRSPGLKTKKVRRRRQVAIVGDVGVEARWTHPYYSCEDQRWITTLVVYSNKMGPVLAVSTDLSYLDLNQCDDAQRDDDTQYGDADNGDRQDEDDQVTSDGYNSTDDEQVRKERTWLDRYVLEPRVMFFRGTHKCHPSTECVPLRGRGWRIGQYECRCKARHFSKHNSTKGMSGMIIEDLYKNSNSTLASFESLQYPAEYTCEACAPNCTSCVNSSPCRANFFWPFRVALLSISMGCILFTLVLMVGVYQLQSVQVFKVASPIFLMICLTGCIIMYSEMAAIFPELDTPSCIATKWTRHMGFCVTFSSLLMKTWRVSLTYRVKSAHKIKLTDNQLLQWLTPILLIMTVYLAAWTISDPPTGTSVTDYSGLQFKQCTYNYWDHCLAAGEMLFLMWGVKVCIGVRKAESLFNEARMISFAVYNITAVNIVMACIHMWAQVGPDLKYFFGFLRTQLSTTATILLIFGPKFLRVMRGKGDDLDRSHTFNSSFTRNGTTLQGEDNTLPLDQENEQLKEEIQKLAAQMEFMRIVHMEVQNRHLKPKPGGYFSERGGLLAVCNTNSTLLGNTSFMSGNTGLLSKPLSRLSTATVVTNKATCDESRVDCPNNSTSVIAAAAAKRKESLARIANAAEKREELEMTKIKSTPTDV